MSVDRHELFKFILQVFRDQGVLSKSGCETRIYEETGVVFGKRTVYTELVKRCLLNVECYEFVRRILLSRGPVQELHCIRDKVIHMITMCLEKHLRAPFNDDNSETKCVFNRVKIESDDATWEQRVVHHLFDDHIVEATGDRFMRVRTTADPPANMQWLLQSPSLMKVFLFPYEQGSNAIKRLSEANEQRVISVCMDAFMSPDFNRRFTREFYRARRRMEDKERNRLYERQFTRFVLTDPNVMLIANPETLVREEYIER
jgi:hypothetical protein